MRAVTVSAFGGPNVLRLEDISRPRPGATQVLVDVTVSGVNYLDTYQRTGATLLTPPYIAGVEGVGVVVEVGDDVDDLEVGQRVGWFSGGQGSFADYVAVEADRAVRLPDALDDETAAALLMQGVTAHYLATDVAPVRPGATVLVHAAAGGVGQLLTQVATLRGGRVIATVSSDAKTEVAVAAGAAHVLGYDDFDTVVRGLTDGAGVATVFDGVGATTFDGSLACLQVRGTLVVHGTASGPTPPLEIPRLNTGGSLSVTRPSITHFTRTPSELRARTNEVFAWAADGRLRVAIGARFALESASDAFEALESRRTTGKILLLH